MSSMPPLNITESERFALAQIPGVLAQLSALMEAAK